MYNAVIILSFIICNLIFYIAFDKIARSATWTPFCKCGSKTPKEDECR